ncbi:dedicator of cytokinesis protein 7-like isoform X2 [Paramacrobiotus metropolitanus]|uniref:dedicator of cytokinesis protein 7-like isoform X2 n=1 Tax=Paramacrobiotus metropolitanus TaxID=2943436 RepID=UPI002445AC7E|nr:dedicator of cytokinesis protein 7-like isoform X2 [Paramacrobiotus metropolitanus]
MADICRVKAIYDFEKSNTDELSFRRGDVITITQKLEGGWWEGTLNGETGWFPLSFVTEYRQETPVKNGPVHNPRREYRAMVLRNIIDSERKHVADMQMFQRSVLSPIKNANLLPENDCSILCGNIDEIIQLHESLVCQFDDILRTPSEQQTVGGVFMSAASALRNAHMKYCSNHPRAVQMLNQYREMLNTFCESLVGGRTGVVILTAELSRPFRRLDKYPNMLQELERHLEDFHFDRGNTQRAVMVYTEIANSCAEIRRQKEVELDILKGNIQDYQGPELNSLGDVLLMLPVGVRDDVHGVRQERFLVIFEDCLLILAASPRMSCFMYMAHSPLSGLKMVPVDKPESPLTFEIWSKTMDKKTVDCKDNVAFSQCLEVLSSQIAKMSAMRPSIGKSNTLPKPAKLLSNGLPPSPPKGVGAREVPSTASHEQHFKPPIITNPIWTGSCLRPYPPLRGELPSKEEKPAIVSQSPKLARKFSTRKTKDQSKSSKTDDQLSSEKTQQYENDALLLGVIDAYCISSKSRHKVTSELLDSPHVLIAEDEKIFIEGSDGNFLEEKSLVDTVYAMKDEMRDMTAEIVKLRKQLDEERKCRKQLEATSMRNGVNGERISEVMATATSGQRRAFAQKLNKSQASEVRRQIQSARGGGSELPKSLSINGTLAANGVLSAQVAARYLDSVEPVDYEEFIRFHQSIIDRDALRHLLQFPIDDIEVKNLQKKTRTVVAVVPENLQELNSREKDCLSQYNANYTLAVRRYQRYGPCEVLTDMVQKRDERIDLIPRQIYECDQTHAKDRSSYVGPSGPITAAFDEDRTRNSWASGVFDLRQSNPDALIPGLLDRLPAEDRDAINRRKRQDKRQPAIFSLYPSQDEEEQIERRVIPDIPREQIGHSISVRVLQLKLDLDIEPVFASIALYDIKERKRVSENFYFDCNSDAVKRMIEMHVPCEDMSTMSRACVFNVLNASVDLVLVVRLEKTLQQGDVAECAEVYLKEEKNKEKAHMNAQYFCERLGKYRMPFAWTAIYMTNVVQGVPTNSVNEGDSNSMGTTLSGMGIQTNKSGSLDRSLKGLDVLKLGKLLGSTGSTGGTIDPMGSLPRNATRAGSIYGEETIQNLDSFRSVTVSLPTFFRHETDKLSEDDLLKMVADLRRPTSLTKKLKCIPGLLKLDISPCTENLPVGCLTPELVPLRPLGEEGARPVKEILEFPSHEVYSPNYAYRNLLYVYPKFVNFSSRPGSARNIAIKLQLLGAEDCPLKVIYGRSSCPEFLSEVYSSVIYHNKTPVFSDEIKIKLPVNLDDREHGYHLFFTFYHISCQKKGDASEQVETPIGYTWLPLINVCGADSMLISGDYNLPIMLEKPSASYSRINPDVQLPNTKWLDNHKGLFNVTIRPVSTIHTGDVRLERFLNLCSFIDSARIPNYIGESNIENNLRDAIQDLEMATREPLIRFLNVIIEKLLTLIVKPPLVHGQIINVASAAFDGLVGIVHIVSIFLENQCDQNGRNTVLLSYIYYHCGIKKFSFTEQEIAKDMYLHSRSASEIMAINHAVSSFERTGSVRGTSDTSSLMGPHGRRLPHEEIAYQWAVCANPQRDFSLRHAWFFFELIVQCMTQYLTAAQRLHYPRNARFSERFIDNISTLIRSFTDDIVSSSAHEMGRLNTSLSFFFYDCLSLLDRGLVFQWVHAYCKKINAKVVALMEPTHILSLKIDCLRILSSHEHFFPLNLPFAQSTTWIRSQPASPCPSISSSTSQNSVNSSSSMNSSVELSNNFRQQHYLVGLVLFELMAIFEVPNPALHVKAVNVIRNLLSWHDADPRYATKDLRHRLSYLYLPLIGIIMDTLPQLYDFVVDHRHRTAAGNLPGIQHSVAMAIAGTAGTMVKRDSSEVYDAGQTRRPQLNAEATRHLLAGFMWILKSADEQTLRGWWEALPPHRLAQLLEIFQITIHCFEYTGPRSVHSRGHVGVQREELKSMLGDAILGSIHSKTRGTTIGSQQSLTSAGDGLRYRKDQLWRQFPITDSNGLVEQEAILESVLCAEINLTILDSLELVFQVISSHGVLQDQLAAAFRVLLHALGCSQSVYVYENLFACQRSIVAKFPELVFEAETEYCADLCLRLLSHCSSSIAVVRSQASASLYLLMRQNFEIGNSFSRVKMQVTISLSSLVGTITDLNEDYLRRSLKTILTYAEQDAELKTTTFPEQVRDLVFNLHMILSDTVKMKAYQEDPEMLMDLMYRIAKGYKNSPDLRLTWLANMAQKHSERGLYAETAHCLIHSAALVSEYLHLLEDKKYLPLGCAAFEKISSNILEESAVSDDIVSPNEEGICTGKSFTEAGLLSLLEQSASAFSLAGMFEAVNEVHKIVIPIAETHHDYAQLASIHKTLHEAFVKIERMAGKRMFGTYFRVGFYGPKFGDLDGEEFIYKEPVITKLPEVSSRLESFYSEKYGAEYVDIIKDSNAVKRELLDPEKVYIQITYVEPHFDKWELRNRETFFQKNYNLRRFVYSTPFTMDGRAHGDLHEQYKRKTIVTTANAFPYVKTRIQVIAREQSVLTPIELAIEDIQKKTEELHAAIKQEPSDAKMLQMVLQGCIGTTVNQGPLEVAAVFLSHPHDQPMTALQHKLRLCFKDFSRRCAEALKLNKTLIAADQKEYQRELEKNYQRFHDSIKPMLQYNAEMLAADELENSNLNSTC